MDIFKMFRKKSRKPITKEARYVSIVGRARHPEDGFYLSMITEDGEECVKFFTEEELKKLANDILSVLGDECPFEEDDEEFLDFCLD